MLNDSQILDFQSKHQIITPFVPQLVRQVNDLKVVSYGLSSAGYDIRLSKSGCYRLTGGKIDVKRDIDFNEVDYQKDETGTFFVLQSWDSVLCVSVELICMPPNLKATCIGKSTYARAGLIVNTTPIEPGWQGYITLELINTQPLGLKVYCDEGIAQLEFHEIEPSITPYGNRKYQFQSDKPTLPRV